MLFARFHLFVTGAGHAPEKQLTIGVPLRATTACVMRILLDRLGYSLNQKLLITHAGRPLQNDSPTEGPKVGPKLLIGFASTDANASRNCGGGVGSE